MASAKDSGKELTWQVRGMEYHAKAWGDPQAPKVLALHGWLDNAATFDVLAPMLNARVVALDFPGHGLSDHFPPQASYNIWDELPELLLLLDEMGWEQCHLLGHSRGATVSFLLASVAAERILSLFLMEGLLPLRFVDEDPAVQLRRFVRDHIERPLRSTPFYATRAEALRARAAKAKMPEAQLSALVERGLKEKADGFCWRNDSRLLGASAMKLDDRAKKSLLRSVKTPGLLLLAEDGFAGLPEMDEQLADCPALAGWEMAGHHHLHLDASCAKQIAARFNEWLARQ